MFLVTLIRLVDQALVELRFADARFVSGDEQNPAPSRIEGEGDAPDASIGSETKFLHVGIVRVVQRVYVWPSQSRSKLPQRGEGRNKLILHRLRQFFILSPELGMEFDRLAHSYIMPHRALCAIGHHSPRSHRFIGSEYQRATSQPSGAVSATTAPIQTSTEPAWTFA